MTNTKIKLGQIIRSKRKEIKMTQIQLAYEAGCTITTINTIEKGRANPTLNTLIYIADVLEIDLFNF